MTTKTTSREINEGLAKLADLGKEIDIKGLSGTGKTIPYIGWFWREVDFNHESIVLGNCGMFVGFMENNKWGYDERATTHEQTAEIRQQAENLARLDQLGDPVATELQTFFDYIQACWDTATPIEG